MPFPWLETPSDYELPLTPRAQAFFTCRARDLKPSLWPDVTCMMTAKLGLLLRKFPEIVKA